MTFAELTPQDRQVLASALAASDRLYVKGVQEVGAAVQTASGEVFSGIHFNSASPFATVCGEVAARSGMVAAGHRDLEAVAAVWRDGEGCHFLLPTGSATKNGRYPQVAPSRCWYVGVRNEGAPMETTGTKPLSGTEPLSARTDIYRRANRRVFWPAFGTGVGLMGALDATVFHHLLRWHNLYVHAGADWRAISDGMLHVLTTTLLFLGVVLLWRNREVAARAAGLALAAGVWLGMGSFQLVDGTLFHKVLHLHPVREGIVHLLPYDAAWIGSALVLLLVGGILAGQVRRREAAGR